MQTDILNYFFRLICDKMSSYNLPIVTQSLLRGHYLHYCEIFLARFLVCFVFNKVAIAFWFRTERPQSFLEEFQAFIWSFSSRARDVTME